MTSCECVSRGMFVGLYDPLRRHVNSNHRSVLTFRVFGPLDGFINSFYARASFRVTRYAVNLNFLFFFLFSFLSFLFYGFIAFVENTSCSRPVITR